MNSDNISANEKMGPRGGLIIPHIRCVIPYLVLRTSITIQVSSASLSSVRVMDINEHRSMSLLVTDAKIIDEFCSKMYDN